MSYTTLGMLCSVGVIYQILIISQLYPLLTLLFQQFNIECATQKDFTLSKISSQWTGFIYILLVLPVMFQRNLNLILKLVSYGTISVVFFFAFTIYKGIENIIMNPTMVKKELKLFTPEVRFDKGYWLDSHTGWGVLVGAANSEYGDSDREEQHQLAGQQEVGGHRVRVDVAGVPGDRYLRSGCDLRAQVDTGNLRVDDLRFLPFQPDIRHRRSGKLDGL